MRSPSEGPIDPRTFEALVEEYADRVYSIALRITGSPDEAADATQDAFLAAYQHRDSFRGEAALSTWLYRIAVNAALQHVRRLRPEVRLEATGYDSAWVLDWSAEPPRQVELEELHQLLEQGIALLPEEVRVALVLRDVEGFSTTEAAEIMELSEAALKSRLHRARVLLRQYLADYLEAP
ncbi:MAG: sigma-70 family RNA polymerase sigma factor [Chloroflexi bacterium]|nr:sigma-70 family RNA polymerase sigma factor [Chloroflexota bacterium]